MLIKLSIKNFAVLKELELDFNDGLTVISGDSGAGKSMIIETIKYLYGKRASSEDVRHDTERSIIEGVFDLPQTAKLNALFDVHDIPKDELCIVRREVLQSKKSIIKINSKVVTLTALRDIMREVMMIHSQGSQLDMLDNKRQRYYLDKYIDIESLKTYHDYQTHFQEFRRVHQKLIDLEAKNNTRLEQINIYKDYLEEIELLNLEPDTESKLEEELNYLSNFEKISNQYRALQQLFKGDIAPSGIVFEITENLSGLLPHDKTLEPLYRSIEASYHAINELELKVSDHLSNLDFDEARLNEIQEILQNINRLKRKHNKTYAELLEYRDTLSASIYELENISESMTSLMQEKNVLYEMLEAEAEILHQYRLDNKAELEAGVIEELKALDITHARFEIEVEKGKFSDSGISQIIFNFSPNLGEPLKALNDVASGGELSRVMLAFQTIFARYDNHSLIILDEIDSGVSGVVASKMARKMQAISSDIQTIVISHLAQTVASADHHLFVDKTIVDNRTVSTAKYLTDGEHVEEIARILSGGDITNEALRNAESLIVSQGQ